MAVKRPNRRTVLTLTAVTAHALSAVGTAVAVNSAGDSTPTAASPAAPRGTATPSAAPSAAPKPAPTGSVAPPDPAGPVPAADVEPVVAAFQQTVESITADTDLTTLSGVVAGAALDELEAQQTELEANGWSLTGATRLDGVTVLASDPAGAPPTATVQACVDSSEVTLLDKEGNPVAVDPASIRRALNIYGLEFADGAWRVVTHTFPNDPSC